MPIDFYLVIGVVFLISSLSSFRGIMEDIEEAREFNGKAQIHPIRYGFFFFYSIGGLIALQHFTYLVTL